MILFFEMTWPGTTHAQVNSSIIQTVALAYPDQPIRVFADPTHILELQRDPALVVFGRIAYDAIVLYPKLFGKTHIVSFGRFRRELATLSRGLAGVPRDESCLVFLLSATSTAIFAAARLARQRPGRIGVQIALHGNLNDLTGWRSRNPLRRAFDLKSAMAAPHPAALRFLVLEPAIKEALARHAPRALARTDVLPHPVNAAEIRADDEVKLELPLRIGLVGQATLSKGTGLFLELARDFRARHGDAVAFYLVGRVPSGGDVSAFRFLAHEATSGAFPREAFVERLARLHFVLLPLHAGYYELSASGALIDALTLRKPVIASRRPIVAALFEQFGEVGYLCDDEASFRATIEDILAKTDATRYRRQVGAVGRARAARLPANLAIGYRTLIVRQFRDLLAPAPANPAIGDAANPVPAAVPFECS